MRAEDRLASRNMTHFQYSQIVVSCDTVSLPTDKITWRCL
jgi:hypothetical protein